MTLRADPTAARDRTPGDRAPAAEWQPARPARGLWFDAAACLPLRHRGAGCTRCADTCPTGAILLEAGGLAVSAACTGCGRCAAVCPMGALESRAFTAPPVAGSAQGPVTVECGRVPPLERAQGAVAVPCLGGLDTAWLVDAHRAAGDGPVLRDRGLCGDCASGDGAGCPVRAALAQARDLLEYMGVPPARLPRRVEEPLPDGALVQPGVAADCAPQLSRRAFLGQLGRRSGEAAAVLCAPMADPVEVPEAQRLARPARVSRSRQRLLRACLELARRDGYRLPRPLLHSVSIGPGCCDSGLCRAVCPTAALRRESTGDGIQLVFSALRCIGCGACEAACPGQSFALGECPDDSWHRAQVVARHLARECAHCGALFTALDDAATCDTCAKSQSRARGLFRHLFAGDRSATITEGSGPARGSD